MSAELVAQIRLGWVVLAEAGVPATGDVRTHALSERWALGLDSDGVQSLLGLVTELGPEDREGVVTIINRQLDSQDGSHDYVVIACHERTLQDVFDHFAAGVVEAGIEASEQHPAAVALTVLARWRALFRPAPDALTPGDLAALIAELMILAEIVGRDPRRSLGVWAGPSGARHDFRRGKIAIEVKATLSHTARGARINGIDQLEPPEGGTLVLAWHRFERVEGGRYSVVGVADQIIAGGVPAGELYRLLEQAGSPASLREMHGAVRFELRERCFFTVRDDFPRIVPASFVDGPPLGVDDLTYGIELPAEGGALGEQAIDDLLSRIGGAA